MDAQQDLDVSVLPRLVGNDAARCEKFARLFLVSMQEVLTQVDSALEAHNMVVLAAMGHRAKSTAQNVGASRLHQSCVALEQLAKNGHIQEALQCAARLRPEFEAVRRSLELHFCQQNG